MTRIIFFLKFLLFNLARGNLTENFKHKPILFSMFPHLQDKKVGTSK